jgi:hypothetical protein
MKFYLKKIETTSKRKISDNIHKRQRPSRLLIAYRFSELVPFLAPFLVFPDQDAFCFQAYEEVVSKSSDTNV